jgi:DNA-binding SARP family transcriptional activator/tetratricopeptide (TPR) repeat protein
MGENRLSHDLQLLGTPKLVFPTGTLTLERKTAAVLAYLALEGATHKYRLAGWLWAESGETAARNNMRQLLRRLRVAAGEVVTGEDQLELSAGVHVDVQRLSALQSPSLDVLRQDDELLSGYEYDDAPDFEDWLIGAREEWRSVRARAAASEADHLEQAGQFKAALEYALAHNKIEPLSEEGYRRTARLQYLIGERGAARHTLERCRSVLREELGIEPLAETVELARLLERGTTLASSASKPKESLLPTAILRPPVLAGREREWALMEEAWARGQIIYLVGDPGVGKTRLALDFASSKGEVYHFRARPGDASVPYASQARAIREILNREPDLLERVPRWARLELTRLLPELSEGDALPPLASEADKLRYFEAMAEVMARRSINITVADDVQFSDSATAESSGYLMVKYASNPGPTTPRIINVYRRGELRPEVEQGLIQLVESGIGVRIEVEPLDTNAIGTLLEALPEAGLRDMADALKRFTGGNPLFILETLKDLIESGGLQQGLSARFTPPGKVLALIERRLHRLSPLAQNLARAVAVARTAFEMNLAATVLEKPAFELAQAHAELEEAQILRGNAFTHDLVFEAALSSLPGALKRVLHANTAAYLEAKDANPALVALHWEGAGDGDKTAQWLMKAARNASALGLYTEVIDLLERAIAAATSKALRLEAQVVLADSLGPMGRVDEAIALAKTVLETADEASVKQWAFSVLQNMYQGIGRYDEAEQCIVRGLELAEALGQDDRADGMRFAQARVLRHTGRYAEALKLLERIRGRYETGPSVSDLIQVLSLLGNTHNLLGQHEAAEGFLRRALELAKTDVGPALHILAVSNLLYGRICQGEPQALLEESEALLESGDYAILNNLRHHLALAYLRLGQGADARRHYDILALNSFDPNYRCIAWARLAGLTEHPETCVTNARDLLEAAQTPTSRFAVIQAALLHGSSEQRIWGAQELERFDPTLLPWLSQLEYEALPNTVHEKT